MRKDLLSRFLFFAGLMAVIFLSFPVIKEIKRNKEIEEEIVSLKEEAGKIKDNNQVLEERIAYFETDDYKERLAKERLGLKKEDEQVVVIKPSASKKTNDSEGDLEEFPEENEGERPPNYKKWWHNFFDINI